MNEKIKKSLHVIDFTVRLISACVIYLLCFLLILFVVIGYESNDELIPIGLIFLLSLICFLGSIYYYKKKSIRKNPWLIFPAICMSLLYLSELTQFTDFYKYMEPTIGAATLGVLLVLSFMLFPVGSLYLVHDLANKYKWNKHVAGWFLVLVNIIGLGVILTIVWLFVDKEENKFWMAKILIGSIIIPNLYYLFSKEKN